MNILKLIKKNYKEIIFFTVMISSALIISPLIINKITNPSFIDVLIVVGVQTMIWSILSVGFGIGQSKIREVY